MHPQDDDSLAREVSISARLDESGLDLKTRSRTIAAIDSLMAGWFGPWLAKREAERRSIQAEGHAREQIILAQGEMAKKRLQSGQSDDQVIDAAIVQESGRLANRAAVAEKSFEALKSLPPPSAEEVSESPENISEDWLNVFGDFAGMASSEHLRQLLGRILAGEIRKPGSFSLTTLRVAAELDQEIAEKFQSIVKSRVLNDAVVMPDEAEGQHLVDLLFLEEIGLLQNATTGIGKLLKPGPDGIVLFAIEDNSGLHLRIKPAGRADLPFMAIRITRAGQQLASLLPAQEPVDVILRQVAVSVAKHAETIDLCQAIGRKADGTFEYSVIERLRPRKSPGR